jgi:hypothetical protein
VSNPIPGLDGALGLLDVALDALRSATAELEAVKADLAARQTVDTSATDATQAKYGEGK